MRALVFGSSIAQGFWDSQGGWVNRLRKYYDQRHIAGKEKDPPTIFNLGVSGDSSDDLIERFDNEIKARNRYGEMVVVVAIGTNDSRTKGGKNYSSTDKYVQNLKQLVETARTYTDKILFVSLIPCVETRSNPVAWGDAGYTNQRIQLFEKSLLNFCDTNDLPLVKVFESFAEQQQKTELLPDGVHPNDAGHELIFQLVRPELDKLLAK